MVLAEHAPADRVDSRPVPFDEFGEGFLVAVGDVAFEQIAVGLAIGQAAPQSLDDAPQSEVGHWRFSPG